MRDLTYRRIRAACVAGGLFFVVGTASAWVNGPRKLRTRNVTPVELSLLDPFSQDKAALARLRAAGFAIPDLFAVKKPGSAGGSGTDSGGAGGGASGGSGVTPPEPPRLRTGDEVRSLIENGARALLLNEDTKTLWLLEGKTDKAQRKRLRPGDVFLDGWVLKSVDRQTVVMERDGEEIRVGLIGKRNKP